ncbi:MAG: OsmC family peroxiredoxin [Rubrivivax sp.]|nr:OsmC family peroxiredoxin [Rubrivivax sp.]
MARPTGGRWAWPSTSRVRCWWPTTAATWSGASARSVEPNANRGVRRGTNPEEILGAAHAACLTMAFSFACDKAGFATTAVDTQAQVRLVRQGEGFVIDRIALTLKAIVPGIDEARFQEIAHTAKRDCPLSKALASVPEITLQAALNVS